MLFYLRMFFERIFINVVMVAIAIAFGIAFVVLSMSLDTASVIAASQDRMPVLWVVVFSMAFTFSMVDVFTAFMEDVMTKKEEEKEKEAAQCSEKLTSPSA